MGNVLEYKGYQTKVEYDAESNILYGKIEGIRDLINFEAENVREIENSFHEAVDDYLKFCEEVGKSPDKAYNGQFNVRIDPQLHKKLAMLAFRCGESLNKAVQTAIEQFVNGSKPMQPQSIIILQSNEISSKGVYNSGALLFNSSFDWPQMKVSKTQ